MKLSNSVVQISVCIFSLVKLTQAVSFCGGPVTNLPQRWNCIVEADPQITCQHIYFDLSKMESSNAYSEKMIERHRHTCCSSEESKRGECLPHPGESRPDTREDSMGEEPVCDICGKNYDAPDEFPGYPDKKVQVRYVGRYTCRELYYRGHEKKIPEYLCGALQDEAYEICGCGTYHPFFGNFVEIPSDKIDGFIDNPTSGPRKNLRRI
jgi:hypothetical protein